MDLFRLSDRRRDEYAEALAYLAARLPRKDFSAGLFPEHAQRAREATTRKDMPLLCKRVRQSYGLKHWGVDSSRIIQEDGSLDREATARLHEVVENVRIRSASFRWWF